MATESYGDITYNNLEVDNLISDYQKFYFNKNIIIINQNNSNYVITNLNSNNVFIIDYENGIVNFTLSNNLKNGINIEFYFKSSIYQFNIINNNLYNFYGSYYSINNNIIGKSILKNNINTTKQFKIYYDISSMIYLDRRI